MDRGARVTTRSRTGCNSCRKRRIRCDEKSFPVCKNCESKGLKCKWTSKAFEYHKKMKKVRYIGNEEFNSKPEIGINSREFIYLAQNSLTSNVIDITETSAIQKKKFIPYQSNSIEAQNMFPEQFFEDISLENRDMHEKSPVAISYEGRTDGARKKIIEKIALQQDCVLESKEVKFQI